MRALIARRSAICRSRGGNFRCASPFSALEPGALPCIPQRLLFFTRHLAELPLVGFRCCLAGATPIRDDASHPENIVTRDPMLGAKARHFLISSPVIPHHHPEKPLRPRLPLSLHGLNPARQSIDHVPAHGSPAGGRLVTISPVDSAQG